MTTQSSKRCAFSTKRTAPLNDLGTRPGTDFSCYVKSPSPTSSELGLLIEGMSCAACALKIERALNEKNGVKARISYATQRLSINWDKKDDLANEMAPQLVAIIRSLGFEAKPFDLESQTDQKKHDETFILRALSVAGFATVAIMLFSDALWFTPLDALSGATRDLMHWSMALIALPTTIYSGQPFYKSALSALKSGQINMDFPISVAILLSALVSLIATITHEPYVYYDASVMLIFFLLIGRYLDQKARLEAGIAARGLLAMMEGTATIVDHHQTKSMKIRDLNEGMTLLIAAGEKIAADSLVLSGTSEIDDSLITGESLPRLVKQGDHLHAGTINLSAPLKAIVTKAADDSLLSEVVRLMEKAEQGQSKIVRLADKVAQIYAPWVHIIALLTFLGWLIIGQDPWQSALMKALAVLIITCPCALGLAVPVTHVIASAALFKRSIILKSNKGLEALSQIDTVIFDKTGTLTLGRPNWLNSSQFDQKTRQILKSMTAQSRHPLSLAINEALTDTRLDNGLKVHEIIGCGLEAQTDDGPLRLGKASWVGGADIHETDQNLLDYAPKSQSQLWLSSPNHPPLKLCFEDTIRPDAHKLIAFLTERGLNLIILSGDKKEVVTALAQNLGIAKAYGEIDPLGKQAFIKDLMDKGHKVLMIGDGLNDAAALKEATVSISASSGLDIAQNAADFIFKGQSLKPIRDAVVIAKSAMMIVRQNLWIALGYNLIAIPLAISGQMTPMIAAIFMSASSLMVVFNAFRLKGNIKPT